MTHEGEKEEHHEEIDCEEDARPKNGVAEDRVSVAGRKQVDHIFQVDEHHSYKQGLSS